MSCLRLVCFVNYCWACQPKTLAEKAKTKTFLVATSLEALKWRTAICFDKFRFDLAANWKIRRQAYSWSGPREGICFPDLPRYLCAALLTRLAGSGWDAYAKTLRITALFLLYFTTEYCSLVWCRSVHTRFIDSVLNDTMRLVTRCLRLTPSNICRHSASWTSSTRSNFLPCIPELKKSQILTPSVNVGTTTVHEESRLRFRHFFVPAARKLLDELSKLITRDAQWTDYKLDAKCSEGQSPVPDHMAWVCPDLLGYDSTILALVLENFMRQHTNVDLLLQQSMSV